MSWLSYSHVLPKLKQAADARERQKAGYESSKTTMWRPETHLPGLIGEWCYGQIIGREPDWTLLAAGDKGADFGCVDVKASTFLPDPDLKVKPTDFEKGACAFVLVVIDEAEELCGYAGWARAETMKTAPLKDYGHGPMRALNWRKLERWSIP